MPDNTPPPPQATEAKAQDDGWRPNLGDLRARLDEIDDKIHDLLIARARVVEGVARSGKTAAFRPGREAAILRRLVARHTGQLPARTLVRMWREMLAGTTGMQSPVTVAAAGPEAIAAIAREHFGALTPVVPKASVAAALDAVRTGLATVAVIPFPGDASIWAALTQEAPRLYVIARLPFWTARPGNVPMADAIVIATTAPDASGDDRSFIANASIAHPGLANPGLANPGLANPGLAHAGAMATLATHGAIAEVAGMIAGDDPRLPQGAIVLGGYAVPIAGDTP